MLSIHTLCLVVSLYRDWKVTQAEVGDLVGLDSEETMENEEVLETQESKDSLVLMVHRASLDQL